MVLGGHDDVFQTLTPKSANEPPAHRTHPRAAGSDLHDFGSGSFGDSVGSVASTKEVTGKAHQRWQARAKIAVTFSGPATLTA
jgi:hypothetical protein